MKPISLTALILCISFVVRAQSAEDSVDNKWSGSLAGYYYFIPGDKIPPTITGCTNHKSLHLESRYNYEDINSLSVFAGYNFEKQYGKLDVTITPMAGILVGHTKGVLPALELNASWCFITLYSENEYMLDFKGKKNYFFYSWSQLSAQTFKNISAGVLAQSLRWYQTKFAIQRGIYIEYNLKNFTLGLYYFNPFTAFNFTIISASFAF